ncbi:hypothetical protein [Marinigracilibium pacificum]|uniref:Uncharacterized protein n=1 Tax=Marinigracilibium pacificum TaxID=2729599 RepID=A0A848IZE9_9BACT|nr:hypothetical protein [Marinigracilibium pacificum]NMM49913.1 hypothetical protein [Marinigracilibium pacificum]
MSLLNLLDLIIGLVFIFFILSIVVSSIQEFLSSALKFRSENLESWVKDTLNNKGKGIDLGDKILKHSLIERLVKKSRKPSYIPTKHFVEAFLENIQMETHGFSPYTHHSLKTAVEKSQQLPDDLKFSLLQSISESKGELQKVRSDIGNWFDNCMERVSGTYKSKLRPWIIGISVGVCLVANADLFMVSKYLYENDTLRERLVLAAERSVENESYISLVNKLKSLPNENGDSTNVDIKELETKLNAIKAYTDSVNVYQLPLGWEFNNSKHVNSISSVYSFGGFIIKLIGILLSGFAVSLGAPFWFDLLNKLVNIRGVGKRPGANE